MFSLTLIGLFVYEFYFFPERLVFISFSISFFFNIPSIFQVHETKKTKKKLMGVV